MILLAYLLEYQPVAAVNEAVSKCIITFKKLSKIYDFWYTSM